MADVRAFGASHPWGADRADIAFGAANRLRPRPPRRVRQGRPVADLSTTLPALCAQGETSK
ncbi:hypothetical protein GCM10010411_36990 [Actinomadura fulvescens]|uniref:Uncharacterized protein n=1 Tax=Actinomadura fulvescens TaxID=46160 RepID=A0ABN3PSK6_9ACTN